MTKAPKLVARGAHRDWVCPDCGKMMAKVYDQKVVARTGNLSATFPFGAPVKLTCPRCTTETMVELQEAVA